MELTKYELARIIGARSLQLSLGAPALIKVSNERMTFFEIAQTELSKGILPLVVYKVKSFADL
jgi:DNA-directed RNA polymerase subunit K/omega